MKTTNLVLAAALAAAVFAVVAPAEAGIFSYGSSGNRHSITQAPGNDAGIYQNQGGHNSSSITQSGSGGLAVSVQDGKKNTSTIDQSGDNGHQIAVNIAIGGKGNTQSVVQKN